MPPERTPPPDTLPLLRSLLHSYPVEDLLAFISRTGWLQISPYAHDINSFVERRGLDPRLVLRPYQLAYVVRTLIEDSNEPDVAKTWPAGDFLTHLAALVRSTQLVSLLLSQSSLSIEDEPESDRAGILLIRTFFQQFSDFHPLDHYFARAVLLFRVHSQNEERTQRITLDQVMKEQMGLDMEEWLFITFSMYAFFSQGQQGQFFRYDFLDTSVDFPGITREHFQKYFLYVGADYGKFRETVALPAVATVEGYEPYNFNPLIKYPAVQVPDGAYVIPLPGYFFRRTTDGIYYDLIALPRYSQRVANIVGSAIENYVAQLITDLPSHGTLYSENQIETTGRRCDFALEEDGFTLLLECKRKSIKQRAKTTGLRAHIKSDINEGHSIIDGILQIIATAQLIQSGGTKIDRDTRIMGLVVTLDNFYGANIPYIRDIIEESLKDRGHTVPDFSIQICSLSDLEDLCRLLTATSTTLTSSLARKIDDSDQVNWDLGNWARTMSSTDMVGMWPQLPSHASVYDNFLERLKDRFRQS